jgi:transitional endoplasmic reticulum ATPase
MDSEEEEGELSIENDFVSPFSEVQFKQCKNPWDRFSHEEEFYILYDAIVSLGKEERRKGDPMLRATKLANWFHMVEASSIPPVPPGAVAQEEKDLDDRKLAWGRAVRAEISGSELLVHIWALRFDELGTNACRDPEFAAKAEANLFRSPPHILHYHEDKCQIDAEIERHRFTALRAFHDVWEGRWKEGESHSEKDVEDYLDNYAKEHATEFRFLAKRSKDTAERIKKELDNDPAFLEHQKKLAAERSPNLVIEFIQKLLGDLEDNGDCGNPDCPIHGPANRKKTELKSLPPSQEVSGLTSNPPMQQLPRNNDNKESQDTMATKTDSKIDDKDAIKFTNISVQFVDDPNSKAIQLPNGMTYKEGRHWLKKIEDEETRTFSFQYKFTGWSPLDAMWAAYRALSELHGFVHVGDFQSWLGPTPPSMITIEIDYGVTQQMPWGPIEVSGFSSPLVPSLDLVEGHPTLVFSATIRNNERGVADKLMKKTDQFLREASIYRGKAIEVDFEVVNPRDFRFDPTKAPKFWDTSKTKLDELILSNSVERLIRTNIWTPIRKTEQARQHQIPLRRTTLLAGNYGVGKTLGARATAKIAQENGWTFLYLRNLSQLKAALYFAKKYQPCVIFAEDINRITAGKRDAEMDELFNVIDGIDRKNDEVMLVFTTNNIEEIHPGMIRPGRIDTVITVTPPDADAAERLVRLYGRNLIDPSADLKQVGVKLAGQIPAIIREAVERSKLAAIEDNNGGPLIVSAEHLDIAADQMLEHAEFLREPEEEKPDLVILGETIGAIFASGLNNRFSVGDGDDSDEETVQKLPKFLLDQAGRPDNGHNTVKG